MARDGDGTWWRWHVAHRRRLREPHVARISCELPVLQRLGDDIAVAELATRGVHEVGTPLEELDGVRIHLPRRARRVGH